MIEERKKQLPFKALKSAYPNIFRCAVPHHKNFRDPALRTKFNICLISIIKMTPNMRIIKLKEIWDYADTTLVSNGKITPEGEIAYWRSISASVKFNHFKCLNKDVVMAAHKPIQSRLGKSLQDKNPTISIVPGSKRNIKQSSAGFDKYQSSNGLCFDKYHRTHWSKESNKHKRCKNNFCH